MSFDLAVWYPHQRVWNEEAAAIYLALCGGQPTLLQAHAALQSFYDASARSSASTS